MKLDLDNYSGVAVGDTLELDPGTPIAEIVTIVKFGSIYLASPTRFQHVSGTIVRRLVEGTGARWEPPVSGVGATASSRPPSAIASEDAGFEDKHRPWSQHAELNGRKLGRKFCLYLKAVSSASGGVH